VIGAAFCMVGQWLSGSKNEAGAGVRAGFGTTNPAFYLISRIFSAFASVSSDS